MAAQSAQELSSIGLNSPGTPSAATTEVGCDFTGQRYTVTLAVDPARTFDGYIAGSQNQAVRPVAANGRRAAIIPGSSKGCSEIMKLGGGVTESGTSLSGLGKDLANDHDGFAQELSRAIGAGWQGDAAATATQASSQVVRWGREMGTALDLTGTQIQLAGAAAQQANEMLASLTQQY